MDRRLAGVLALATTAALGVGPLACADRGERPEVLILVVVDTLRADRIFAGDDPRWQDARVSPQWLERARVYQRAFSTSAWTLPSFASLYTGQVPSRHGAGRVVQRQGGRHFTAMGPELSGPRALAGRLSLSGFATGAIVTNAALAPDFGVGRGFDAYDYTPATNDQLLRAHRVVDRALAWIDRHAARRCFLLVHLFDPHMDYDAPPPFRGRFTGSLRSGRSLPVSGSLRISRRPEAVPPQDRRFIAAAYDEEVAFVDAGLARLLEGLEVRGVLDRGLVALTSDHGEELFEHGGFEHGHALWQQVVHVPLAFWGLGVAPGRDATPVSGVDLAPTLLDAAGVPGLPDADGVSLWADLRGRGAIAPRPLFLEGLLHGPEQKGVVEWPYKLVWWPGSGEQRLYDLSRDPGERRPVRDAPDVAARLLTLLPENDANAPGSRGGPPPRDSRGPARSRLRGVRRG